MLLYLPALLKNWQTYVALAIWILFSLPNAVLNDRHRSIYDKWISARRAVVILFLIASMLIAPFLVWREERSAKLNVESDNKTLSADNASMKSKIDGARISDQENRQTKTLGSQTDKELSHNAKN